MKRLKKFFSKKNSEKELKGAVVNVFYLFLIQGLNYILPLLTLPYLLTILSGESFGIYVYSLASMQFMMLVVDFGFTISITKKITTYEPKSKEIIQTYWLISIIQLLIFLVVFSFSLIFIFSMPFLSVYKWGILTAMVSVFWICFFSELVISGFK